MFGFGEKKNINEKNIKKYKVALRAIKIYTSLGLFKKALIACDEIIQKEKKGLDNLIESNKDSTDKKDINLIKKETKIFEDRKKEIEKLKEKARVLEIKYSEKIKKERFKENFKKIKKEIKNLLKLGKPIDAMSNLRYFLENNKERTEVVNFYNKQKRIIQKALDRQKEGLKKKMKNNAKAEAMNLIGAKYDIKKKEEEKKERGKKWGLFSWLKPGRDLIKKIEEEKTLEEVNKLIEQDKLESEELAKIKLENVHKGLVKELKYAKIPGYNIYGKILGADKISGDVFSIEEKQECHTFFLGDATGHGVKAGLIITLLNKNFKKFVGLNLKEMILNINNSLKQSLESKNFITGAFFEINKKTYKISYVGMGHEPIIIYKNEDKKTTKKGLGGLASGIRIIEKVENVRVRELDMKDGDIFLIFSDGIVEAKNEMGDYYGIDRLQKNFELACNNKASLNEIYDYLIENLKLFKGGTKFNDDATILIVERDKSKDIIEEESYLDKIKEKEGLSKKEMKELAKGRNTKEEIDKKIKEIKRKKEIERIVEILKNTYYNGEILKLKQDSIRYVKDGYIDKRINFYLRKAIENEKSYKIEQKEQKMRNKFMVLDALYKKGNYDTVIKETENIIAKDGI